MEMSNRPQYNVAWGVKNNKEMAVTRNMATIIWYFMKREMCGTAPNIRNVVDYFKVSRSQLSQLIMAKKFKSGPDSYVPKKRRAVVEGETSGAVAKTEVQDQEAKDLEGYSTYSKNHDHLNIVTLPFHSGEKHTNSTG